MKKFIVNVEIVPHPNPNSALNLIAQIIYKDLSDQNKLKEFEKKALIS